MLVSGSQQFYDNFFEGTQHVSHTAGLATALSRLTSPAGLDAAFFLSGPHANSKVAPPERLQHL